MKFQLEGKLISLISYVIVDFNCLKSRLHLDQVVKSSINMTSQIDGLLGYS